MVEFQEWPKIARLSRDCVVTEKIDGTNASVLVPEDDGPLLFGSRTRWITPESDNYGFARVRDCALCGLPLGRVEVWYRGRGPWHRHCWKEVAQKLLDKCRTSD